MDGGIDQRLLQPCYGFANMSSDFKNLLTNWYITENKTSNEPDLDENTDGLYYYNFNLYIVIINNI